MRRLRCEECEWVLILDPYFDAAEVDDAYARFADHDAECRVAREALIEQVFGVVYYWHDAPHDEIEYLGPPYVMRYRKPGPVDRRFWHSLMP